MQRRHWLWAFGLPFLAGLAIGLFFSNVEEMMEQINEPLRRGVSDMRVDEVALQQKEPFSVLLLGIDERDYDRGRSDTIIVLTVNPHNGSTKMLSVPRDTYTEIVGYGTMDKINHAYAFGGTEMAMASVENLLRIPIDYVIQINMEGFKEIVDAIGGVPVQNNLSFGQFPAGEIHLDGEEALEYVRMRKQDPRGEFGRQDRQKQVVRSMLEQGISLTGLLNYRSIMNSLGSNVRTNMTLAEIRDMHKNYRHAMSSVDQLFIDQGHGETINGIWYYRYNETELASIRQELRQHLDL